MRITKSYNETPKGIQLEFDPELSNTDLKKYLISIGFKNANRNKGVWYIRGVRPSFDRYTSALENTNKEDKDLVEVKIEPSYEAIRGNIDHKLFSLVTASIENEDQETKDKDYVVFEDFRVSAEDIAKRFLRSQLGDKFKGLKVTAKNFKEKARNAFDEGRIITIVQESKKTTPKKKNVVQDEPVWNKTKEVYLSEILGKKISNDQLNDPDVLTDEKHEHKIAILTALRNGKDVSDLVLQDYPLLLRSENFQFGFDKTNFRSSDAFLELLKGIGNTGIFIEGAMVDGGRSGFLWKGDNLKIVTANNPLFSKGKASFIGIEGFREQVLDLVNLIEGQTASKGELGLDFISFSDYDFSKPIQPISLTNEEGVYTRETAGDRYEIIKIPFSKKAKYEATIRLVKDEHEKYLFAVDFHRKLDVNFSSQGGGISRQRHDQYNFKSEAIQEALKIFIDNIQEGLSESYDTTVELNERRSASKIALTEIGDFAEKHNVFLISELSQNGVKNLDKENLLIEYPEIKSKKLDDDTLRAIIEQLIEELTDLEDIAKNKDTEDLIVGTRLFLEESLSHSNEESLIRDLKEIIDRLESAEEPLPLEPATIENQYIEKINKLARLLRVKTLIAPSHSLTDGDGMYTKETAGERLEVLEIPFPESVRVEASITIVQDEEDYYLNGLEFFNRIGSGSNNQFRPKRGSTRYNSKKEAIRRPLELIAKDLNTELIIATTIKATEKLKAVQSALLSLKEFATGQGIELSIEDIELGNDKSVEEKEETKVPHSDIKRATVQSMVEKLTDLEIDTEGETETIIATLRLELEEALQIENEVTFLDKVEHVITDQKDWINDIEPEAVRNTFLDLILSNAAALGYTPFTVPHSSGFLLEQAWTKLDGKTVTDFEKFINSRPEFIKRNYYPDESEPHGLVITSDRDEISFQILKKNRIAISGHKPLKEGVIYGGSTMSTTKLKKAIRYIISNPSKVVSNENTKDTEAEKENPVITDITRYGTTIPNVLTPHRVIALFNSGLYIKDAKKIQEIAPYLLEASDDNLSELSAKELFELVQMAHPNDYGFSVTRSAMLREWERRGKELFEEIGFPTDPNYLYVNLNRGYRSVYLLQNIIDEDRETQSWWHAAAMYRPIADLEKALEIIEEEKADFKKQQLVHTNPKTGKPKSKKEDKELYRDIEFKIEDLDNSKELIAEYLESQKKKVTSRQSSEPKKIDKSVLEDFFYIKPSEVDQIRKKFGLRGFTMSFTGKQAFIENVTVFELGYRYELNKFKLDEKTGKEFNKWIEFLEKEIEKLNDKEDKKSKSSKAHREERILDLKKEAKELAKLVEKEDKVFRDELFFEFLMKAKDYGYVIDMGDIANFRDFIMDNLFGGRIAENYPDEPIAKMARVLIDDFFTTTENEEEQESWNPDYLDKVVAIMHDHYIKNVRLSKKKIEAVKEEAGAPNLGALWEAVELSWLLWYKQIYNLPIPFVQRLGQMVEFWNTVQPTYAYSDSSKELFKQYSTPCPIGAMVAEYTQMSDATRIFEPSAGNGLLVLGADPEKAHVNEIDKSRRYSLELQRFNTITHLNAAEPFPEEFTHSFDVMVTNPPFASWDDSKFDKERWTQKYFNNQIGVAQHMRLEHFMAGLALHTLKDTGKAAIIIMGHVYFGLDGYIEKYKPFFNWLYRHYNVDDIINMNSYKLYNKQGAVAKTMLILIDGRKQTPVGVAPTKKENPSIEQMVESFPELWERINSHIKKTEEYTLEVIITQLKIELGL